MSHDWIRVRGAREHNLKNINVDIPRDKLVVISGLSGSGKSSLAFDTIYAEGQRRYVESLSSYARQFLDRMGKPDVDAIEGLSPAISIDQKTTSRNPRSTVGTVTEIQDYLRLLFARVGVPHCPNDGAAIVAMSVPQIVDSLLLRCNNERARILAPILQNRKGTHKKLLDDLHREGFVRAIIDGNEVFLEQLEPLEKSVPHTIALVVDRIAIRESDRQRLSESLETALRKGEGYVEVELVDQKRTERFSEKNACAVCGEAFPELTPQLFSFNSPIGACPECDGLGNRVAFDEDLVVANPDHGLADDAIPAFGGSDGFGGHILRSLAQHYKFALHTPFKSLPPAVRKSVLYGSKEPIQFTLQNKAGTSKYTYKKPFEGVIPSLERRMRESTSQRVREDLEQYMRSSDCSSCGGDRLNRFARAVRVSGHTINTLTHMELSQLAPALEQLSFSPYEWKIAEKIVREIRDRVRFLVHVGLDYLNLARSAHTLSGGEAQRIRLATQIGSKLMGVLYVLDEPSIGLHQADQAKLIETLITLRDLGNTVLVVEHDEETIRAADYIVDMGPEAGLRGGAVIALGTPAEIEANSESVTGRFLASRELLGRERALLSGARSKSAALSLTHCSHHNLQDVDVRIPLNQLISVTGVSGSGKSSLIMDTLYPVLASKLHAARQSAGAHGKLDGVERIQKVLEVSQEPIGRTPRSNPATYTGIFGDIRELFARVPEAKARGYSAGRFSFNVKGGRCEACEGDGLIRIEMHFLPDIYVQCDVCKGSRYARETLEIMYRGKSIVDVLNMDVDEACGFFANIPAMRKKLETMQQVGLGYIKLGQSATTLSGGEAQRLKLSRELSRKHSEHTLYILDEPTTGLHFEDVRRLVLVLQSLVDAGNTVLVIEHNLDLIAASDHVIDMGPGGGRFGGRIVGEGTPRELAQNPESRTGHFLAQYFRRKHAALA